MIALQSATVERKTIRVPGGVQALARRDEVTDQSSGRSTKTEGQSACDAVTKATHISCSSSQFRSRGFSGAPLRKR